MMIQTPLLSVRLMVYNNLPYIKEALDSVLAQKTTFDFEIVIGDDFSTDGTLELLKEYAEKHPDVINLLDRPVNGTYYKDRMRLGRIYNWTNIVDNCKGKYIAVLDGDDYWTDIHKLQKQVDFLEAHQDYCICFGKVNILKGGELTGETNENTPLDTDFDYLIAKNFFLYSSSIVFNKTYLPSWGNWVYKIFSMDLAIQSLLSMTGGKIKMLNESIAIYRIHSESVLSKSSRSYIEGLRINQLLVENLYNVVPQAKKSIVEKKLSLYNDSIHLYFLQNKTNKLIFDRLIALFLRINIKINKLKLETIKNAY